MVRFGLGRRRGRARHAVWVGVGCPPLPWATTRVRPYAARFAKGTGIVDSRIWCRNCRWSMALWFNDGHEVARSKRHRAQGFPGRPQGFDPPDYAEIPTDTAHLVRVISP